VKIRYSPATSQRKLMPVSKINAARHAIMMVFLIHGVLIGGWVTQIPAAKMRLETSLGMFGVALLSFAIGAVLAMPIAGALINRFGSAKLTLFTGLGFCALLFAPALATTLPVFMIGGALLGAFVGSMDVAMNSHGIAVEKEAKRPVMSGFHGGFSVGAAIGTIGGAYLLQFVSPLHQLQIIAATGAIGILICARFFLPASADKGLSGSHFAMPTKATIGLGLLCFLALMIEGSVADWGALMFVERFAIGASTAAMAFGFYQGGMAISRFMGDRLRLQFGAVQLVAVSAIITALGTAGALILPSVAMSLLAFFIAGIGIGNIAPVLFAGGGRLEPDAPGRGIAAVTSMGYSGFLAGPPMIGILAEFSGLQAALFVTVIASLIIAVYARMVQSADTF
jgi:MFS family permease